jgi:hypothetical protein
MNDHFTQSNLMANTTCITLSMCEDAMSTSYHCPTTVEWEIRVRMLGDELMRHHVVLLSSRKRRGTSGSKSLINVENNL